MTLLEGVTVCLAAVQTAYTVLTFHGARSGVGSGALPFYKSPVVIMAVLALTSWGAVSFDVYDRKHSASAALSVAVAQWGVTSVPGAATPTFTAIVDTTHIQQYAKKNAILLIVRSAWPGSDRLSDTFIDKSQAYNIDYPAVYMAFVGRGMVRFIPQQPISVEFYIVMMPKEVVPGQIITLDDVQKLGGRTLARVGQTVLGGAPGSALPSSNAPAT